MLGVRRTILSLVPVLFRFGRYRLETEHSTQDTASLQAMFDCIRKWCVVNQFLVHTSDGRSYVPNITGAELNNRLRSFIYSTNFKQLCVREHLNTALAMFQDTNFDHTTSRLYDLHLRLITEIDSRVLNLYLNTLHHGLTTLYPRDEDEDVIPWEEIFRTYPSIWLLFPIQQIMRDHTPVV